MLLISTDKKLSDFPIYLLTDFFLSFDNLPLAEIFCTDFAELQREPVKLFPVKNSLCHFWIIQVLRYAIYMHVTTVIF